MIGRSGHMSEFAPEELPHPGHSLEVAKRCICESCDPDEHDWVELTGPDEPAYWRECRYCGIGDVTAAAVGQNIAMPNIGERKRWTTCRRL